MDKNIKIFIGKAVDTKKDIYLNLLENAHLVIAGSTGSGKSNFLLSVIASLMKRFTPAEVQFILADPKRVEFSKFSNSQYLNRPIIFSTTEALETSKYLVDEMENRYINLQEAGVRDLVEYSKKTGNKMGHIFFIADEISDFMVDGSNKAGKKIEKNLIQLAQMSRPVGIHMIIATSRPCKEVLPVSLFANLTMKLAFQMATEADSVFFLDRPGAEKLLGKGDGLFYGPTGRDPIRVQTTLVTEEEIDRLTE